MIEISDDAKSKLIELCNKHEKSSIKLKITNKGCSGHKYQMDFDEPSKYDEIILLNDQYSFIIDSKSIMYLIGTKLIWINDNFNSKFDFINPNAKADSYCGCGESFSLK